MADEYKNRRMRAALERESSAYVPDVADYESRLVEVFYARQALRVAQIRARA